MIARAAAASLPPLQVAPAATPGFSEPVGGFVPDAKDDF